MAPASPKLNTSATGTDTTANNAEANQFAGSTKHIHTYFAFWWTPPDEEKARLGYIELMGLNFEDCQELATKILPPGTVVTPATLDELRQCEEIKSRALALALGQTLTPAHEHTGSGHCSATFGGANSGGHVFLAQELDYFRGWYEKIRDFMTDHGAEFDVFDDFSFADVPKPPVFKNWE